MKRFLIRFVLRNLSAVTLLWTLWLVSQRNQACSVSQVTCAASVSPNSKPLVWESSGDDQASLMNQGGSLCFSSASMRSLENVQRRACREFFQIKDILLICLWEVCWSPPNQKTTNVSLFPKCSYTMELSVSLLVRYWSSLSESC